MTRFLLAATAALALMGCQKDDPDNPDGTPTGAGPTTGLTTGVPTGSTPSTGTPTGSTTTSEPWRLDVDCDQLLPLPLTATSYNWVPSHEDFTFSWDGQMWGAFGGNLHATPFGGPNSVVVPGTGDARGTRFLADGTLVMANIEDQSLIRVDPATGSVTTIVGSLTNPNGIAIGLDGKVYVATTGQILRIDPDTGDSEVVADMGNRSFDGLTFTVDYTRLYFNEEFGRVNWVDFDADGNPGQPVSGPNIPIGAFSILDGMTADACGNIYVVEMQGKLWRIDPNGTIELAIDLPGGAFAPAVNFGPPAGGWNPNAIYVNDFLGKIYEAEVGVPSKWEPHHF